MHKFELRLKKRSSDTSSQIVVPNIQLIQPFVQLPAVTGLGLNSENRMDAHDLFSQYTVRIIKQDIIYAR